jgi:peptide-methionine (S)-S-oxide reductase
MSIARPLADAPRPGHAFATLGGGCFWCLEAVYEEVTGVVDVESGYTGGSTENPTYRQVCDGRTGHAEVVRIEFDPRVTSYREILEIFFAIHDPTQLNRQGNDVGTQYRSAIFVHSAEQRSVAQAVIAEVQAASDDRVVTEVADAGRYWRAETYHQEYFRHNMGQGYCMFVVAPKVAKFRQTFAAKRRNSPGD